MLTINKQGPVILTLLRHVARILANGRAAFFESCDTIGWILATCRKNVSNTGPRWRDRRCYHCFCVKFVLRLVHSFYGLVHAKQMLKGNFIKCMHLKSIYKNVMIFFAPNMRGKWLHTIAKLSIFGTFDSRETLCSKNWKIWGELDIRKPGPHVCLFAIIYTIERLGQSKFTRQQVNI